MPRIIVESPTILNKGLGVGLAIIISKVNLHFRMNLGSLFWIPKH